MASPSTKPIVLITGGNAGLGLAIVQALCEAPAAYEILIGSRSAKKGEEAIETISKSVPNTKSTLSVVQVDLASDESIQQAAEQVSSRFGGLDVLVNNAGANFDFQAPSQKMTTRELWNTSWDVNVAGTQVLTECFIPLLLKSSDPRLIFMTSGTASLGETDRTDGRIYERLNASPAAGWPKSPSGGPAYRSVKTGLNMMMREWYRILKNDGVKVWAISPGLLATGLGGLGPDKLRQMGAKEPSEGANFVKSVIEGKRDHDVGTSIRDTETQPW